MEFRSFLPLTLHFFLSVSVYFPFRVALLAMYSYNADPNRSFVSGSIVHSVLNLSKGCDFTPNSLFGIKYNINPNLRRMLFFSEISTQKSRRRLISEALLITACRSKTSLRHFLLNSTIKTRYRAVNTSTNVCT